MRHVLLVLTLVLGASVLASTATASELIDRNAQGHRLRRQREGRGARHVHGGRQVEARARLGRAQRDRADARAAAGVVQARLLGRLRQVQAGLLEDLHEHLQRLRRPGARVEGDGVQGARRLVLGAPGVAAHAAELRRRADRDPGRLGASALALDGRPARAARSTPTGRGTSGITSSARSRTTTQPVFGFRSTPAGVPLDTFGRNIYVDTFDSAYGAGLEAREQLPDAHEHGRLLLLVQPARRASRRARARSTARRSKARASRPT